MQTRLFLSFTLLCAVVACAIEGPASSSSSPANSASLDGSTMDAGSSGEDDTAILEKSDATLAPDVRAESGASPSDPNCTLTVSLTTSPKQVASNVTLPAGSSPRLCWTTPSGAILPDADGWDLSLQREDAPSGDPADAEWSILRGIPPEKRQIAYAACPPKALACFPAKTLRPGAHVLTIWDGTRVGGLGGALTFDVQ